MHRAIKKNKVFSQMLLSGTIFPRNNGLSLLYQTKFTLIFALLISVAASADPVEICLFLRQKSKIAGEYLVVRFFSHNFAANIADMSTQTMTRKIAEYFKTQPVVKAWLFGSFARGEETSDSDVDILVEYDKDAKISLLTISHMMGELEKSTGRRVDLVEDGCLLPFAVASANRDKKLIYERGS